MRSKTLALVIAGTVAASTALVGIAAASTTMPPGGTADGSNQGGTTTTTNPTTPPPTTPTYAVGSSFDFDQIEELFSVEAAEYSLVLDVAKDECETEWRGLIQAKKDYLRSIVKGGLIGLIPVIGPGLGFGQAAAKLADLGSAREKMEDCCKQAGRANQTSCLAAKDQDYLK